MASATHQRGSTRPGDSKIAAMFAYPRKNGDFPISPGYRCRQPRLPRKRGGPPDTLSGLPAIVQPPPKLGGLPIDQSIRWLSDEFAPHEWEYTHPECQVDRAPVGYPAMRGSTVGHYGPRVRGKVYPEKAGLHPTYTAPVSPCRGPPRTSVNPSQPPHPPEPPAKKETPE